VPLATAAMQNQVSSEETAACCPTPTSLLAKPGTSKKQEREGHAALGNVPGPGTPTSSAMMESAPLPSPASATSTGSDNQETGSHWDAGSEPPETGRYAHSALNPPGPIQRKGSMVAHTNSEAQGRGGASTQDGLDALGLEVGELALSPSTLSAQPPSQSQVGPGHATHGPPSSGREVAPSASPGHTATPSSEGGRENQGSSDGSTTEPKSSEQQRGGDAKGDEAHQHIRPKMSPPGRGSRITQAADASLNGGAMGHGESTMAHASRPSAAQSSEPSSKNTPAAVAMKWQKAAVTSKAMRLQEMANEREKVLLKGLETMKEKSVAAEAKLQDAEAALKRKSKLVDILQSEVDTAKKMVIHIKAQCDADRAALQERAEEASRRADELHAELTSKETNEAGYERQLSSSNEEVERLAVCLTSTEDAMRRQREELRSRWEAEREARRQAEASAQALQAAMVREEEAKHARQAEFEHELRDAHESQLEAVKQLNAQFKAEVFELSQNFNARLETAERNAARTKHHAQVSEWQVMAAEERMQRAHAHLRDADESRTHAQSRREKDFAVRHLARVLRAGLRDTLFRRLHAWRNHTLRHACTWEVAMLRGDYEARELSLVAELDDMRACIQQLKDDITHKDGTLAAQGLSLDAAERELGEAQRKNDELNVVRYELEKGLIDLAKRGPSFSRRDAISDYRSHAQASLAGHHALDDSAPSAQRGVLDLRRKARATQNREREGGFLPQLTSKSVTSLPYDLRS